MKVSTLVLVLVLGLALVGCDSTTPWPPSPAPLALGEEACASCRMIVSDGRFAVEAISRDGGVEFYDDIGCLVTKRREAPPELAAVFVRDHATEAWVRGDAALVVREKSIGSPMGSGLAGFADRAAAEAEAARRAGARLTTLEELLRGKS